jgi:tryptophanyl-tRNA synthetase
VGDTDVKAYLTNVMESFIAPIRERRKMYENDPALVTKILTEGTEKARTEVIKTLEELKTAMKLTI